MVESLKTRQVKLSIYRHEPTVTYIDSIRADDWGEFLIMEIDIPSLTPEEFQKMSTRMDQFSEQLHKQIIMIPAGSKIEFYGIEEHTDVQE